MSTKNEILIAFDKAYIELVKTPTIKIQSFLSNTDRLKIKSYILITYPELSYYPSLINLLVDYPKNMEYSLVRGMIRSAKLVKDKNIDLKKSDEVMGQILAEKIGDKVLIKK